MERDTMKNYSANWEKLISKFGYGYVNELEQYQFIVKVRAYTDMQPRTIHGLKEFHEDTGSKKALDKLFDDVADKLYLFVVKDPARDKDGFNEWHTGICKGFVKKFNEILGEYNKKAEGSPVGEIKDIKFGKGQKLINCSLKYIYCLKGADKYEEKFKHCHMILDRYTYSEGFYKKNVIEWYNKKNNLNKKDGLRKTLTSWSNLDETKYKEIQENIRNYLNDGQNIRKYVKDATVYVDSDNNPLTPFQAEFYVFDEYNDLLNNGKAVE